MNFKRMRITHKATGNHYRKLGVQVINTTSDVVEQEMGMVLYCDKEGTMYFTKELKEFNEEFLEGWISKEELEEEGYEIESSDVEELVPPDTSIHFTITEDQTLEEIVERMKTVPLLDTVHHCFLSRETVEERELDPAIINFVESIGKEVICYSETEDVTKNRKAMFKELKKVDATAIFVGEIVGGVEEEMKLAKKAKLEIIQL